MKLGREIGGASVYWVWLSQFGSTGWFITRATLERPGSAIRLSSAETEQDLPQRLIDNRWASRSECPLQVKCVT